MSLDFLTFKSQKTQRPSAFYRYCMPNRIRIAIMQEVFLVSAQKLKKVLDIHQWMEYYSYVNKTLPKETFGVSFNGRTADSGSVNWGSNPCTPAKRGKLLPLFFVVLLTTFMRTISCYFRNLLPSI